MNTEKYKGGLAQTRIYLGKFLRMFVFQNDWKVLPMGAFIAGVVTFVVGQNVFVTQEGTLTGSFALVCVCIWNGFFNSIQVVCRERDIVKREHRAGMHITSYVAAHMIYQAFLCILQAGIIIMMLNAMSVNRDGLESVLEGVEAEAAPALEAQLRLLAESAPRMYWLSAVDYLCMLVISVCAARLLWYSMEGGLKPADIRYLPLVFAVRLVGESLLALYQNGGGSFLACAGSYYVLTAALACFTWYQASQRDSKELLHDEHLKSRMRLKR